jgi:hypothetical protein
MERLLEACHLGLKSQLFDDKKHPRLASCEVYSNEGGCQASLED